MTSTIKRNPCAKCSNGKGIAACNGCHQIFCINHFTEHREVLSKLMDNVSEEHDYLQSELCRENLEHPFLSDIDKWEQETIEKIKITAKEARNKLQQIFEQKKNEIKSSIEKLSHELQSSQKTADYTEIDINNWTEKLKKLRETLENWSTIHIEYDNHVESIIHPIKICEQQLLSTGQSFEPFGQISEESSFYPNEKFDKVDGDVVLSEGDLVAKGRSTFIFSNRFIYGVNRYSSEKHDIHFCIENKEESPIFIGIITSSQKYQQTILISNNSSVYGWWDFESFVIGGKRQENSEKNILKTGDELILTVNCHDQQISLQHKKTKQLLQIPVTIEKCPFPWKIIVGLSNSDDCIRIIC